ncbi:prostaglandin E2 receptor EP3 subtype [Mustelus asterias]
MDLDCLHSQADMWNESAEERVWGDINSSSEQPGNKSWEKECVSVSVIFPVTMMITGIVGNTLALLLVYRSYHKKENKRKKSFLLIIGALALTDLTGKLLTSPVVISVYLTNRQWSRVDPSGNLCAFFGVCMTTFGLCPLFLASAMAIERTFAIHAPQFYSSHMTTRLTKLVVLSIWVGVVIFALLPIAGVGRYTLQWPGTWCFINTGNHILGNTIFASTFTVLGITSLLVTLSCNVATIRGLVVRCKKKLSSSNKQWERITAETLIQLMGIMCVLCVCWSPLLVLMLKMTYTESSSDHCYTSPPDEPSSLNAELKPDCNFLLTAIRLASLNQILDPWVYLLLREILLRKVCQVANAMTNCSVEGFKEIPVTVEARNHMKEQITEDKINHNRREQAQPAGAMPELRTLMQLQQSPGGEEDCACTDGEVGAADKGENPQEILAFLKSQVKKLSRPDHPYAPWIHWSRAARKKSSQTHIFRTPTPAKEPKS